MRRHRPHRHPHLQPPFSATSPTSRPQGPTFTLPKPMTPPPSSSPPPRTPPSPSPPLPAAAARLWRRPRRCRVLRIQKSPGGSGRSRPSSASPPARPRSGGTGRWAAWRGPCLLGSTSSSRALRLAGASGPGVRGKGKARMGRGEARKACTCGRRLRSPFAGMGSFWL